MTARHETQAFLGCQRCQLKQVLSVIGILLIIHELIEKSKLTQIRFEKEKIYRVIGRDDLTYEVVVELLDAANIKIEGRGSTFVLHPTDGLENVRRSRNIQIDGLRVDYDPLPYYQGAVKNIDIDKMTVDLVVLDQDIIMILAKQEVLLVLLYLLIGLL